MYRDVEAECLGGLEVDHQIVVGAWGGSTDSATEIEQRARYAGDAGGDGLREVVELHVLLCRAWRPSRQ